MLKVFLDRSRKNDLTIPRLPTRVLLLSGVLLVQLMWCIAFITKVQHLLADYIHVILRTMLLTVCLSSYLSDRQWLHIRQRQPYLLPEGVTESDSAGGSNCVWQSASGCTSGRYWKRSENDGRQKLPWKWEHTLLPLMFRTYIRLQFISSKEPQTTKTRKRGNFSRMPYNRVVQPYCKQGPCNLSDCLRGPDVLNL